MSTAQFVHLSVHSQYSMIDSMVRIKPLMKALSDMSIPAVALTDQCNFFAAVKFYRAAINSGIKPLFGSDLLIAPPKAGDKPHRLTLLCSDQQGYKNLTYLISQAYLKGQQLGTPMIQREWFEGHSDGLIALCGGREGELGRALLDDNMLAAKDCFDVYNRLFPGAFYIELQRTERFDEERHIEKAVAFAETHQIPVVATNAVRFIEATDFDAHEARVAIHDGYVLDDPRRPKTYSSQQYLKSADEMLELFSDIPEATANTVEIAKRCNVQLHLGENYLPNFPIPELMTVEGYLAETSRNGLEKRLKQLYTGDGSDFEAWRKPYDERLVVELDVINGMGFPGYFLIVADFIQWAKEHGIPVGPGRGSGAGSLVAYALDITDLDPLEYELLFERFLNPERVSMPDFDIDFCMEGRDRVIEYVAEKYGRDSVSQIITFGSMAAKAVVRDVGRVLAHPYGFVDRIAKLIPFEIGITLEKALAQEEEFRALYENDDEVRDLLDLAMKLEGLTRNAGKHAGGVVIAPSLLTDFSAIYCEEGSQQLVSQFDKDDVEAVGLVKFDFLGLRTLTIINWAVQTVNTQQTGTPIDIATIPTDDEKSFDLLKACQTTAVFQLESRGMKDLIHRLQPDCFEDIIALVALFRPGPLQSGMVDDFIDRKHGRAAVEYPHPKLEPILKPTYGVILYQEQVMQIAQVLAGYSLGAADMLRRAMGKKKPEEMAKQRTIFTEGALAGGVEEKTATYIFDLMEKFAGYGFNKSHSAAYALVAYQTAWMKAHYPAAFMAAVLSADMDNTDKVVILIEECKQMKLQVCSPSINKSYYKFTTPEEGSIVYGLGAIKGVGESAIEAIVDARASHGNFNSLFDLCRRVDLRKVNRRVLEALIRSGAMDDWGISRAMIFASIERALKLAEQQSKDATVGQHDIFSLFEQGENTDVSYIESPIWSDMQRLNGEKETLGLYLTGHPMDQYHGECDQFTSCRLAKLDPMKKKQVVISGLILGVRRVITKRGKRMGIVSLDDGGGRVDVAVFSELYEHHKEALLKDEVIIIEGEISKDDYTGGLKMTAQALYSIDEARAHYAKCLSIGCQQSTIDDDFLGRLADVLTRHQGKLPSRLNYDNGMAKAAILLGKSWRVLPSQQCINELQSLSEALSIEVNY